MELHKLLSRQLSRQELNENTMPSNLKQWQDFLDRVNKTYNESDQERYLLERSLEISSREMTELNQKLETAQQIARLGYWYHNRVTKKNIWSKELYSMFGLHADQPAPNLEKILELTHEQDRPQLKECIEAAFSKGLSYELEIRLQGLNEKKEEYRWYHMIVKPLNTSALSVDQLAGVMMDITGRKKIEEELEILHQQLVTSARRAGMADVATSILHNVGNVLNSANVSVELILEYINDPYFSKLFSVNKMIVENSNNLSDYFTNDPKGKLLPQYLMDLNCYFENSHKNILKEIEDLDTHMNHIREITAMQKSLSGVSDTIEKIYIPEIIDSAIKMCGHGPKPNKILIYKKLDGSHYTQSDRIKLLQIMVNLVQNAKDALLASNIKEKIISISTKNVRSNEIELTVSDNGAGIPQENLTKIFSLGFTTKPHGHGFGLHSSAIVAKELGGSLIASSNGLMQGAVFTLTLPLSISDKDNNNEDNK